MGSVCIVPTTCEQLKELLAASNKFIYHDDRDCPDPTGCRENLRNPEVKIMLSDLSYGTRLRKYNFWGPWGKTDNRRILAKLSGLNSKDKNWALSVYGPGLIEIAQELAGLLASHFDVNVQITQVTTNPVYEILPENNQGE